MGVRGGFEHILDAALPEARTVLVLGAGRGVNERELRAPERRVIGVDVDPAILENPFLDDAVLYDGASLPFACRSVDLCVARWVVEHMVDPASVLEEVTRVVRPGGRFVFITTNKWFYAAIMARLIPASLHGPLLQVLLPDRESRDTFPAFYRANTRPALRRLLPRDGWTEEYLHVRLGGPDYLRFSAVTHSIGIALHRTLNRMSWLEDLRHSLVGAFRRT